MSSISNQAAALMETLGLTEDELCQILDADALTLLSGQVEHVARLRILATLVDEAAEQVPRATLKAWVRTETPHGRPIDALLARAFGQFENALDELTRRGVIVRKRPDG
jgi:hypothetical protein